MAENKKQVGESEKVRFAVVGCGHIGKRHIEMILGNPEAQLVALCDIKPAQTLGVEKHAVPFFESIDLLLKSNIEIDVVCVCTPNGLHAEHSIKSLESGFNVVCEKPMALSRASCQQMIDSAQKASKQIFVVMQNRYSPPAVWLKQIIEDNKLGDIFMVQVNCFWNRDHRYYNDAHWRGTLSLDGGTLFTQFAHFVDMIYWLFGNIHVKNVSLADFSHSQLTEFEDSGFVSFSFENGGEGCLNFSTSVWDKNMESSITVIGSQGSVKVGGQYMNQIDFCHVKDFSPPQLPPSSPPNSYGAYKGSAANHHFVIQNVVDVLKGKATPTTSEYDGMVVVDIIERIYAKGNNNFTK